MLCATIAAQSNDSITALEEVIIIENRLKLPLNQSARNIQVLRAAEIEKLPAKSLNEILSYVNGVDIRQRGAFGTQADLSIDGGSFEQTLVLVNGIKISDPQTAHNTLNLPFPVEAIERIEVLRGPAARIYGANSLTGAVNIVTKKPTENQLFAQVMGGTNFKKDREGNGELYHAQAVQLGGAIAKEAHAHQLYGALERGTGYRYNTAHNNLRLAYQGNANWTAKHQLEWLGGYTRAKFGANGFYAAPGDVESEEVVETVIAAVQSKHQLTDNWQLRPQLGYRYTYDDYRYFRHNLASARSQHYGNAINAQINASYTYEQSSVGLGAEWRHETINSSNIGSHERDNFGLYGEWKTQPIANLHLTVGAYAQYNSQYQWAIFPGADASYTLNSNWRILANLGSSQRIPSFSDLYLNQAPGNVGNPNLNPETAWQWEAGWAYHNKRFRAQATIFWRDIHDFIDWNRLTTAVPYQSQNTGTLQTLGASVQASYNWQYGLSNWNFKAGYTYLDPKQEHQVAGIISKYRLESLRHQLLGQLNYSYKNWQIGWSNRYQERLSYTDYWLSDLRLSYTHQAFTYFMDAQNIGDVTYIEAGAVPMPGRWISLGIKLKS